MFVRWLFYASLLMDIDILFFTFVGSREATFNYTFLSIFLYQISVKWKEINQAWTPISNLSRKGKNPDVDTEKCLKPIYLFSSISFYLSIYQGEGENPDVDTEECLKPHNFKQTPLKSSTSAPGPFGAKNELSNLFPRN